MSEISLDWRNAPTPNIIISRLVRMWDELDASGELRITLGNAPKKTVIKDKAVMRNDSTTLRKFATRTAANWARFYSVTETVMNILGSQKPAMSRFVEYKEVVVGSKMTMAAVRRALLDLALTLRVHPLALGVIPQSSGEVYVPQCAEIECCQVTNIVKYLAEDPRTKKHVQSYWMRQGKTTVIEPLLASLKVRVFKGRKIKAVIVLEHRNMKGIITGDEIALKDTLVVMTAGYPSTATREFLHMLGHDPALADVPFLFFSDHDMQGIQIFSVLKYGAAATAWASEIMVSPLLEWAGPSKEDLLNSPKAYRASHEAQYRSDHGSASDEKVQEAGQKFEDRKALKIATKFHRWTKTDAALKKGFEGRGWLQHEDILRKEIEAMENPDTPSKFRLADLAQVDMSYPRMFIQNKVVEMIKIRKQSRVSDKARSQAKTVAATATATQSQLSHVSVEAPVVTDSPATKVYKSLPQTVEEIVTQETEVNESVDEQTLLAFALAENAHL